jgi:hypothetical protein
VDRVSDEMVSIIDLLINWNVIFKVFLELLAGKRGAPAPSTGRNKNDYLNVKCFFFKRQTFFV